MRESWCGSSFMTYGYLIAPLSRGGSGQGHNVKIIYAEPTKQASSYPRHPAN